MNRVVRLMALVAALLCSVPPPSVAQCIVGHDKVWPALSRVQSQQIDVLGIGDSNWLLGGDGWDHGLIYGFAQQPGVKIAGTHWIGIGTGMGNAASLGNTYQWFGAHLSANSASPPAAFTAKFPATYSNLYLAGFAWLNDSASQAANASGVWYVNEGSYFDHTKRIALDVYGAQFAADPTSNGGWTFRGRNEDEPNLYSCFDTSGSPDCPGPAISTWGSVAADTMTTTTRYRWNIAANTGRADNAISYGLTSTSGQSIFGPLYLTLTRMRSLDDKAGVIVSAISAVGGHSTREMSLDVEDWTQEHFNYVFGIMRSAQLEEFPNETPFFVFMMNFGANDISEVSKTAEENYSRVRQYPGGSPEAFVDNTRYMQDFFEARWVAAGWPLTEVYWVMFPTHPMPAPEGPLVDAHRAAMSLYCADRDRTAYVDLACVTSVAEMQANVWYASGGTDTFHLVRAAYETIGARMIGQLMTVPSMMADATTGAWQKTVGPVGFQVNTITKTSRPAAGLIVRNAAASADSLLVSVMGVHPDGVFDEIPIGGSTTYRSPNQKITGVRVKAKKFSARASLAVVDGD